MEGERKGRELGKEGGGRGEIIASLTSPEAGFKYCFLTESLS